MTTATLAMLTPTSMMFIMFILLLMFGAKKLPELARGLGQAMKEFSKAKNDIHDEIMRDPAPTSQVAQQPPQIAAPGTQPQPAPGTYAQNAAPAHPTDAVHPAEVVPPAQPAPAPQPGQHA